MTRASDILKYDNCIGNREYLVTIVTSTSVRELSAVICELLRSQDFETFSITCLFLRDSILFCSQESACQDFLEYYPNSSIVKTLESFLFIENCFIRRQVIYTLGKTCSYSSTDAMSQAFHLIKNKDPLLLPRLIGEMVWLGAENVWNLVEEMTINQDYITRWAAIETLSQFVHNSQEQDEMVRIKYKFLQQLRQDLNTFVRSEAEYEYLRLKFSIEANTLPKAERKKKSKEIIKNYKPALSFDNVKVKFENYLYANDRDRYSLKELEAFIKNCQ